MMVLYHVLPCLIFVDSCDEHKLVCFLLDLRMFRFRFAGDVAELGIIRGGALMKVQAVLNPRVHLVCNDKLDRK